MRYKTTELTVSMPGERNAPDDLEEGQFTAYASTWTRMPDAYGDVVAKGAFTQTLKEWALSGDHIPILYCHNMEDPQYNIGYVKTAVEDDHGLLVIGQLDIADNPTAQQVYRLLKGRRLRQMSFAFTVEEQGRVLAANGEKANELRRVKLYEVSIVVLGANQDTSIEGVKSPQAAAPADDVLKTIAEHRRKISDIVQKAREANRTSGRGARREDFTDLTADDVLSKYLNTSGRCSIGGAKKAREDIKTIERRAKTGETITTKERSELEEAMKADILGTASAAPFYGVNDLDTKDTNMTVTGNHEEHLNLRALAKAVPTAAMQYSAQYGAKGLVQSGQTFVDIPVINQLPFPGFSGAENPPRLIDYLTTVGRETPVYDIIMETEPADTGKNAAVVPPYEEKPVKKFGLSRVSQTLKVIAVLTEYIDRFVLEDAPSIKQWLGTRLTLEIYNTLENEILHGNGTDTHLLGLDNIPGTQAQDYTNNLYDTIMFGINKLESIGVGVQAIALSTSDWMEVQTRKNAEGRYYMSNVIDPTARTMWGHQIVQVPGLTQGHGWVIGADALAVSTDRALRVEWEGVTGFSRNTVRGRVEGRFALDVFKPHAIVKLDLNAPTSEK